jgi:predicted site-specific integrase-resolvase
MNINDLKEKLLWQMTGEEFLYLQQNSEQKEVLSVARVASSKKHVYGIVGIARLFGCSMPTANRIKQSGQIDKAITQIGRKIIVDAELALELAGRKTGGRK